MERGRALTYDEFTALAQENYAKGGNVGVECWDEEIFDYYVKEFGPVTKTKALRMFERWKSEEREQEAMMFGWGEKEGQAMTDKEVVRYLTLVDRKLTILTSGIRWKPEYGPELEAIDREIEGLREKVDREHGEKGRRST